MKSYSVLSNGCFDVTERVPPATGLRALEQSDMLPDDITPALRKILQSSAIRTQCEIYHRFSADADHQKKRFLRELTAANVCLMISGVLSGLVLASGAMRELLGSLWTDRLVLILGLATLSTGAFAAMLTYWARESDRLRRWLRLRGSAEAARCNAFRELSTALSEAPIASAAQGLALIREHLLNEQRSYLRVRAACHRRSAERTTMFGGFATALAFVGGSGAIITSFIPSQSWITVAGVVGIAVAAYASNRESLRRDDYNADLSERAVAELDEIATRFDAVEAEVQAGNREAIIFFTDLVIDSLNAERQQWREGSSQAESAILDIVQRTQRIGSARDNLSEITPEGEQINRNRILRSVPPPDS
jgi:type IV secretory pathway TrbD component